jgi:L-ribulose-5-phosphate 3-epimerase UlaE
MVCNTVVGIDGEEEEEERTDGRRDRIDWRSEGIIVTVGSIEEVRESLQSLVLSAFLRFFVFWFLIMSSCFYFIFY